MADLRFSSIFGQSNSGGTGKRFLSGVGPEPKNPWSRTFNFPRFESPGPQQQQSGMSDDFMSRISAMQRPGPAMSEYQEALRNQPKYEDYAPSKWRAIAAGIAGAGAGFRNAESGAKIAENINSQPYARAKDDWWNKLSGLGESAKIESDQTQNISKAYNDSITRRQAQEKSDWEKQKFEREQQLEWEKYQNPNLDYQASSQGFVGLDPRGRKAPLVAGGVPTSLMTAMTGERNADTNAQRMSNDWLLGSANFGQRQVEHEDENKQRDRVFGETQLMNRQPDPQKYNQAYGGALRGMWQSPEFRPFIERTVVDGNESYNIKDGGGFWGTGHAPDSPVFKEFLNELRRRTESGRSYNLREPSGITPSGIEHIGPNFGNRNLPFYPGQGRER